MGFGTPCPSRKPIPALIPLKEAHLRKILVEYVEHDHRSRCHQCFDGNAPEPRGVEDSDGSVYAIPHLGGLHHEYRRAG